MGSWGPTGAYGKPVSSREALGSFGCSDLIALYSLSPNAALNGLSCTFADLSESVLTSIRIKLPEGNGRHMGVAC